jgi:hypothetical protein
MEDRTMGEKPKRVSINTRKLVDVARVTPNLQTMGIIDAGADGGLDHGHGSRVGRTRLGKGLDVTVLAAAKRKDASGHGWSGERLVGGQAMVKLRVDGC